MYAYIPSARHSIFDIDFLFSILLSLQGKARGRRSAIYMRSLYQKHLQTLGVSVQKNAGKVLFVAILVLSTFCVGLKSATIHSKVHQLWIQGKHHTHSLIHVYKKKNNRQQQKHNE